MMIRAPVKTLLTLILLAAVTYALLIRVTEYAVTAQEINLLASDYKGVAIVEVSSPVFTDFTWSDFLTSDQYNPAHPDGTWEETRYKALTKEQVAAASVLPHVTYGTTRYMTAGVSDMYLRPLEERFHNYTDRIIIDGSLAMVSFRRYGEASRLPTVALLRGEARVTINDPIVIAGAVGEGGIDTVLVPTFFRGAFYDPEMHNLSRGLTLQIVNRTRVLTELMLPFEEWEQTMAFGERCLIIGRVGNGVFSRWLYAGDSVTEYHGEVLIPLAGKPENYMDTEEMAGIRELAEIIQQDLYTFDVVYTENLSSIPRFNSGTMGIIDGRELTDADAGSLVCVISRVFAERNGLEVGSKIDLGLADKLHEQHSGLGALAVTRGRFARPVIDVELEIVGIYDNFDSIQARGHTAHWSYSAATVFVPLTLLPESADVENAPLKPGAFSIVIGDARDMSAFLLKSSPVMDEMGLTIHFFDGGWLEIEREFILTQRISLIAIISLFMAALAAVMLVVYIYVLHRKRDFAIMRAMGCPRRQAGTALLLPLIVVAVAGVATGSIASWIYSSNVRGMPFPVTTVLACVLGLILFLLAAAWLLLWRVGQLAPLALLQGSGNNNKRKATPAPMTSAPALAEASAPDLQPAVCYSQPVALAIPPIPARRRNPALRQCLLYVLRSVRRSWLRSMMTVIVAAMLFGATGQLAAVRESARILFDTMPIKLAMMGWIDDRFILAPLERSLIVDASTAYKEAAGPDFWTGRIKFTFIGDPIWLEGRQAALIVTTDVERYYGVPVEIERSDSYMSGTRPCAMSSALMDELGLTIGDSVTLYREVNNASYEATFEITGRVTSGNDFTVLIPQDSSGRNLLAFRNFTYVEYTVTDNHRIPELRSMAADLTPLGITYTMATEELERVGRNLALYDMFFPVIAVTLSLIGGMLPALMILQAAKEASLLRALGTTKRRTRILLSAQQLALCFLGMALGLAALLLYNDSALLYEVETELMQNAWLSGASYFAAAMTCSYLVTYRNVLELLQTKE